MDSNSNQSSNNSVLSLKTVIRTRNYDASKAFYTQVLELEIIEEYDDGNGSKGVIMRFGSLESNAFIEVSEIMEDHDYFQKPFGEEIKNDKIDIQLRTNNVSYWVDRLKEKWKTRGPVLRPWGSYYLYLRDPDGMQIIIYQEKSK